jgi:adenylate kinase
MGDLIVLIGPTGAGKTVQGDLLAQKFNYVHFSSGRLLRQDPHSAAMLVDGRLAPAEEVERVIGEAIDKVPEGTTIVLDGFPRTMSNVHWLQDQLGEHHRRLKCAIVIDIDKETSFERLDLRDRADDAPQAVEEKWKIYNTIVREVIDHYAKEGLLVRIDGHGTIEQVHARIMDALR